MDMLSVLHDAETALPALLHDTEPWNSLLVDYHKPTVERLWRQWGEYRIYLHRIHTCEPGQALFHPHPWPSAVRVIDGRYEMTVGYRPYGEPGTPPVAVRMVVSAPNVYEMTDPGGWHAVRPLSQLSHSIMVAGKPIYREAIGQRLRPLAGTRARQLMKFFRRRYRRPEDIEEERSRAGYGHESHD